MELKLPVPTRGAAIAAAAPVSDKPYSPNPSLKRARSDSLSMELPALPRIGSETILEVFTHRTLRFSGAQDDSEYGNSDRLAAIGRTVLETAITMVLFNKRPMITGDEIKVSGHLGAVVIQDTQARCRTSGKCTYRMSPSRGGWVNTSSGTRCAACPPPPTPSRLPRYEPIAHPSPLLRGNSDW